MRLELSIADYRLHLHTYLYCLGQVWVMHRRLRLELTYNYL